MHQPDYRDKEGRFFMPWVFLHSIKDYFDMPYLVEKNKAKATFNLTPILIEQINEYVKNGYKIDRFLSLLFSVSLNNEEKEFVVKISKSLTDKMILNDYQKELLNKNEFNENEFLDLKTLFLLSWCGNYLKNNNETVKNLLSKGGHFSYEDLRDLVKELFLFMKEILPFYKKLQKKGVIEITTTPYSHPIMPLLIDMQNAKKAIPSTILPENPLSLKEDALIHVKKAVEIYKNEFGSDPKGFWPSEGAVCEESIEIYKSEGIEWIATDEIILKKSGKSNHFKGYDFKGIKIFFRDHILSDKIGFVYRFKNPKEAVEDFKNSISNIKGDVFIILDGENAWEYYENNGLDFLNELYSEIETGFFSEVKEFEKLESLTPGSWIDGNFNTWVGDEEKNRAWELLYETKRDALRKGENEEIKKHFLLAEGSDWFWWYGKGHYTEYAREFDSLFRWHLKKIYNLLNLPIPQNLNIPIIGSHSLNVLKNEPKDYITPVIDGKITSFFEWLDAGYIDESIQGAMQGSLWVEKIFWGEDEKNLYFRLDFLDDFEIRVFFDDVEVKAKKFARDEIIEMEFSKKNLKKRFEVRFEVVKNRKVVAILPNCCRFVVEIDKDYSKNWFI
ncbi:glycoside hydrolase family 57 protein [Caminibacter sp.]